jgi:hypothetical protein
MSDASDIAAHRQCSITFVRAFTPPSLSRHAKLMPLKDGIVKLRQKGASLRFIHELLATVGVQPARTQLRLCRKSKWRASATANVRHHGTATTEHRNVVHRDNLQSAAAPRTTRRTHCRTRCNRDTQFHRTEKRLRRREQMKPAHNTKILSVIASTAHNVQLRFALAFPGAIFIRYFGGTSKKDFNENTIECKP